MCRVRVSPLKKKTTTVWNYWTPLLMTLELSVILESGIEEIKIPQPAENETVWIKQTQSDTKWLSPSTTNTVLAVSSWLWLMLTHIAVCCLTVLEIPRTLLTTTMPAKTITVPLRPALNKHTSSYFNIGRQFANHCVLYNSHVRL